MSHIKDQVDCADSAFLYVMMMRYYILYIGPTFKMFTDSPLRNNAGWFWLVLIDADWFWFDTDWFWMVLLWQYLQYVQTLLSTRGPRICFNDQHSKMLWHQAAFEQAYKASKMCPLKLGRPLSITFTPSDLLTGVSFPKCHQCHCKSENTVCVWSFLGNSCRRRITLSLAVARSPP